MRLPAKHFWAFAVRATFVVLCVMPTFRAMAQVDHTSLGRKVPTGIFTPPTDVRVGLTKNAREARIEIVEAVVLFADEKKVLASPFLVDLTVRARSGMIEAVSGGRVLATGKKLRVAPVSSQHPVLRWKGHRYYGQFECRASGASLTLVNIVPLEAYVRGVAYAEMGDAPLEAMKAQLVAARSEIVHKLQLRRHAKDGYDFCTLNHCMAYAGAEEENERLLEASRDTVGLVLVNSIGVLDAVFHNVCGGATAGAEDVWSSPAVEGLRAVYDSDASRVSVNLSSEDAARAFILHPPQGLFCDSRGGTYPKYAQKYFRWRKTLSAQEIERIAKVGQLKEIVVEERRASGRVRRLRIVGERGTAVFEKELPIREAFGLPSGFFVFNVRRSGGMVEEVEFIGAGNGHGVGLCQMGAWEMARRGYRYDEILQHYYPDAKILKLY